MFKVDDPSFPVTSFKMPRYERYTNQGCTARLMNVVPVIGHYVTPASWQLGGIDVVDWTGTDTLPPFQPNPTELAYYDVDTSAPGDPTATVVNATPTNRPAGNSAARSNAWAAYWYNGNIYASHDSPMYGDFVPAGSRGLEVYGYGGPEVTGAYRLDHLNPQTQEFLISCTASMRGTLKARKRSVLRVSVRAMGASVNGAKVTIKGPGIARTRMTRNGTVAFSVKPSRRGRVTATVADLPNMLGCKSAAKKVAKASRKPRKGVAGIGTGGAALTGRIR